MRKMASISYALYREYMGVLLKLLRFVRRAGVDIVRDADNLRTFSSKGKDIASSHLEVRLCVEAPSAVDASSRPSLSIEVYCMERDRTATARIRYSGRWIIYYDSEIEGFAPSFLDPVYITGENIDGVTEGNCTEVSEDAALAIARRFIEYYLSI
jgi:hypothetical protein